MTAPVQVRLAFRGAARRFLADKSPEVGLVGSAGTGKTTVALWKLHLASLKVPGCRSLLSRKENTSLTATTLQTFNRYVIADAASMGLVTWFGGSQREPAAFHYRNGSTIQVSGLDKPEKIMSAEFDRILVDEATDIPEPTYEMLLTRLRGSAASYRQMMVCCNPQHPTHWLKLRGDDGRLNLLTSLHRDNPRFFHPDGTPTVDGAEYMARLNALTGVRRLRLLDGMWAAAEGVIYEFGPDNVVSQLPPGWERWPTVWTIDFGYTNPFVWHEWGIDPDGRAWLLREIYRTRRTVAEHCATIKELTDGLKRRPTRVICDHDAEDRATLERELGVGTTPAKKTVKDGLDAVMARLAKAGDGRPRLMFFTGATHARDQALIDAGKPTSTVDEFPGYIWNDAKDAPVKENDHGMDATRYLVADLDLRREVRMGWL